MASRNFNQLTMLYIFNILKLDASPKTLFGTYGPSPFKGTGDRSGPEDGF